MLKVSDIEGQYRSMLLILVIRLSLTYHRSACSYLVQHKFFYRLQILNFSVYHLSVTHDNKRPN